MTVQEPLSGKTILVSALLIFLLVAVSVLALLVPKSLLERLF